MTIDCEYLARLMHDMFIEVYKNDQATKKNLEIYIKMLRDKIEASQ